MAHGFRLLSQDVDLLKRFAFSFRVGYGSGLGVWGFVVSVQSFLVSIGQEDAVLTGFFDRVINYPRPPKEKHVHPLFSFS